VDVRSVRRADGVLLASGATFENPDDGNAEDRTVWRVPLPEPAGGEIALDVAFQAKLPRIFARTGYFRDYFLLGQWFPKLGVYEPAGMRERATGGWNCHQFLEVKSTFSAEKDVTPQEYAETAKLLGRSLDEVRLSDVEVTVLLQPQHAVQAERHVKAAKAAIK
jgi:hypothetical protein